MIIPINHPSLKFKICAIPAFQDNYFWLLHDEITRQCLLIDPGDALITIDAIEKLNIEPYGILITHYHADHIGGIEMLYEKYPHIKIWGPKTDELAFKKYSINWVDDGEIINLNNFSSDFLLEVMETPGHTKNHVSYYHRDTPLLFCGDTLFGAGCGRVFDGTYEQLFSSLQKITLLPLNTLIFCAHEYTLNNLNFALMAEPNNREIIKRINTTITKIRNEKISLPSLLGNEIETNPFLRSHSITIKKNIERHFYQKYNSHLEIFTALRIWKNSL